MIPEQIVMKAFQTHLRLRAAIWHSTSHVGIRISIESSSIFRRSVHLRRTYWQVAQLQVMDHDSQILGVTYLDSLLPTFRTPKARLPMEPTRHSDIVEYLRSFLRQIR